MRDGQTSTNSVYVSVPARAAAGKRRVGAQLQRPRSRAGVPGPGSAKPNRNLKRNTNPNPLPNRKSNRRPEAGNAVAGRAAAGATPHGGATIDLSTHPPCLRTRPCRAGPRAGRLGRSVYARDVRAERGACTTHTAPMATTQARGGAALRALRGGRTCQRSVSAQGTASAARAALPLPLPSYPYLYT